MQLIIYIPLSIKHTRFFVQFTTLEASFLLSIQVPSNHHNLFKLFSLISDLEAKGQERELR